MAGGGFRDGSTARLRLVQGVRGHRLLLLCSGVGIRCWRVCGTSIHIMEQLHPSLGPIKDYLQLESASAFVIYLTTFTVEHPAGLGNEDHYFYGLGGIEHPFSLLNQLLSPIHLGYY